MALNGYLNLPAAPADIFVAPHAADAVIQRILGCLPAAQLATAELVCRQW
jgi:hypothetical protein